MDDSRQFARHHKEGGLFRKVVRFLFEDLLMKPDPSLKDPGFFAVAKGVGRRISVDNAQPRPRSCWPVPEFCQRLRTQRTNSLPRRQIVAHLDRHVVGQEEAKKTLAVAVINHYKRLLAAERAPKGKKGTLPDPLADVTLGKSNILLIGPTGCGKTLLAENWPRFSRYPSPPAMRPA